MFRKKYLLMLILIGLLVALASDVDAATSYSITKGKCYLLKWKNGGFVDPDKVGNCSPVVDQYNRDYVKKIDGKYAYCSEWGTSLDYSVKMVVDTTSNWKNVSNKHKIILGLIIDEVMEGEGDTLKAQALIPAIINSYITKHKSSFPEVNTYKNFYDNSDSSYNNKDVIKYYDAAVAKYSALKLGKTKLPALTLTSASQNMNYSGGTTYISEQITLSGIVATYGGESDTATYTITPSTSAGTATICTGGGTGSGCSNTKTISNTESDYNFYVKVTDVPSNEDVTISVKVVGENTTTYPMVIRYWYDNSNQKLIVRGPDEKLERTISKSLSLSVPDLVNHTITAYKVDGETGDNLSGATLELYRDDAKVATNKIATSASGKSYVRYVSQSAATGEDDFFNHNYYLVEKNAPDGYILNSIVTEIPVNGTDANTNKSTCYHNGGNDSDTSTVADASRCDFDNYDFMCKNNNTGEIIAKYEDGTCNFPAPAPVLQNGSENGNSDGTNSGNVNGTDDGDDPVADSNTGTDTNDGTGTDEGNGGETVLTPEVTYNTVCVSKKDGNTEVDSSYCTDKGNYTLVRSSNGNITITQPNTKNKVSISKKSATTEEEVVGAHLKICDKASCEAQKGDCTPAKTIDNTELSWYSDGTPKTFNGLKKGEYCVIETLPPAGYVLIKTSTTFSIDEYGDILTGTKKIVSKNVDEEPIIIDNALNSVTISKDDIATTKEVPGATLAICKTYTTGNDKSVHVLMDDFTDECLTATLADGSLATWISGTEPHIIRGLPAGTYALVEKIAPGGYSTAESIIFTMKPDGTLTDKDGNSLKDTKIVMHDKKIPNVVTGPLALYVVGSILILTLGCGAGSYVMLNKRKNPKEV